MLGILLRETFQFKDSRFALLFRQFRIHSQVDKMAIGEKLIIVQCQIGRVRIGLGIAVGITSFAHHVLTGVVFAGQKLSVCTRQEFVCAVDVFRQAHSPTQGECLGDAIFQCQVVAQAGALCAVLHGQRGIIERVGREIGI